MTDPLLAPADTRAVGLIAHDLRTQNTDGVIARTAGLLARLFSGLPVVGTLTEQASRGLAKFSAYGRLRAAVAEAATESAEAEQAARVAAVVVETLQDHLRAHHDQQQAFTAAVGRLDDWLAAMRAELTGGPDHIVQRQVDGGATGAILEAGQRVAFASAPLPSLRFFIDKPAILMQRSWYRSSDYLRGAFANDSQDNSCPDRGGNRSGRDAQPRFSAQVVFLKAC